MSCLLNHEILWLVHIRPLFLHDRPVLFLTSTHREAMTSSHWSQEEAVFWKRNVGSGLPGPVTTNCQLYLCARQLRETTQKANFKTQGQEREYYLPLSTATAHGQTSSVASALFCLPPPWFPGPRFSHSLLIIFFRADTLP